MSALAHEDPQILQSAFRLANRAAVAALEEEPARVEVDGLKWIDTRPMLDPREHSAELIDMAAETIGYALRAELAERHPQHPHLLRLTVPAQALRTL